MIYPNIPGQNFQLEQSIFRETEALMMRSGKTRDIPAHGCITREETSIIMNTG
jgi:hypothetical protein